MVDLPLARFRTALASRFRVAGSVEPVELELVEVTAAPTDAEQLRIRAAAGIRLEPFSLVFRGPRERPLDQRTHRLEHPELGTLEIFLVPIQPDADGPRYEAVFN